MEGKGLGINAIPRRNSAYLEEFESVNSAKISPNRSNLG